MGIWASPQVVETGGKPLVEVMWASPQVVGTGEIPQGVETDVILQARGISVTLQGGGTGETPQVEGT